MVRSSAAGQVVEPKAQHMFFEISLRTRIILKTLFLSDTTFDQLTTDLDVENVKRLNAYQDPFSSDWLNVVPSKNLGLKLTDQQLRISLSFRLGAKICEKHTCRCGKLVEENRHHGLSCARSAGRFSRHHNLNILVKQALSSIKVPSILEPNGLTRSDGKRPDGIILAP